MEIVYKYIDCIKSVRVYEEGVQTFYRGFVETEGSMRSVLKGGH